jgi:hypothetical protein
MELLLRNIHWMAAGIGGWFILNGVLHDAFVIANHKGGYDRNLLRLLMDGHILIVSGVLFLLIMPMLKEGNVFALRLALLGSISMLVYCIMIFPFLKSIVTILLSTLMLFVTIIKF